MNDIELQPLGARRSASPQSPQSPKRDYSTIIYILIDILLIAGIVTVCVLGYKRYQKEKEEADSQEIKTKSVKQSNMYL